MRVDGGQEARKPAFLHGEWRQLFQRESFGVVHRWAVNLIVEYGVSFNYIEDEKENIKWFGKKCQKICQEHTAGKKHYIRHKARNAGNTITRCSEARWGRLRTKRLKRNKQLRDEERQLHIVKNPLAIRHPTPRAVGLT